MTESSINAYVEANAARFLDELKDLVSIPSISTLSEHKGDVRRAAEWLRHHLLERGGMTHAELIEGTGRLGHPLVYAEWLGAPGKPTVLVYGHYDVQPVDPLELWRTPPFTPTVDGDNLRARGAVDDKGPMFAVIKALETLRAVDGTLPVNVKVLLEGEEECGGESIANYVNAHPERLTADCALILDTGMLGVGRPTLDYGLRGMLYLEIEARGAAGDLHSGTYGGIAPNPIQGLCWLLAEIKRPDGTIDIPGLYELIAPVSAAERATFAQLSAEQDQALMDAAGLTSLPGEAGYSAVERGTARPTFEVHGISGGFTGEGSKTVIPALAVAKCSLRLVANQEPQAVFGLLETRVAAVKIAGVTFALRVVNSGAAVLFPTDAPPLRAASAALEAEFDRPVTFVRSGGSIPIAALFSTVLQLPGVLMGFGLVDDNVHAPNEKFYIPNFYHAIRSVAGFLQRYGAA